MQKWEANFQDKQVIFNVSFWVSCLNTQVTFVYSFVFMKKIPTRVVCVNGKHPCSSKTYFRLK